jgi:cyclopropane fatty-acyl-phospholipid synthase-like methyltransferase
MYFRQPRWDTHITPPEVYEFLDTHAPGKALDLGCGTGTNLLTLASHGWQVTGIDYAWRAVRIARKRLKVAGVDGSVFAGDLITVNQVNDQFDLILDIGCYHCIPPKRRAAYHANILRWLAPQGTFLLYAHLMTGDEKVGMREAEIEVLAKDLHLRDRQDSLDNRQRLAVWLTFER